jgi:hypothetical protein
MAFPNSPTNGQSTTVDGINYTYSSAENSWTRQTLVLTNDATASPNTVILQGVDVTQNTRISVLEGVNTTQNTNITTVTGLAQAAFDKANTGVSTSTDDYARTTANTATNNIVILQGVNTTQNTRLSVVEGGLISANANTVYLNSLITTNNTRMSVIEGGLISANANSAYLQGALNTANTNINTKFNSSGGTITGSVTIAGNNDLIVTGNLIITGNVSTQNVQQLAVADPLLVLGIGNYVSDTKDIGFAAHYNDGANAHTGIIRDSTTKEFYVFQGYTPEVDVTNNIDITNATFRTANINANYVKGNLIATTAVVGSVNLLDVNNTQNTRISVIEGGLISANANTVYLNGLITTNNTRISVIEGVNTTQNTNITTVTGLAQAAFDKANTGVSTSTDDYARTTANTATNNITILQGVNATQNTNITYGTNLAQAAYNQANTGGLVSNTGIITVDTFTGDGTTVAFTLSVTPVTKNYTSITIDGATQLKSAYSLSGNIVTLSGAPLTGENIEVISFTNGVITSYDTVARDIANTATNNITILQGVNTTQNTRISSADNTATAAYAKANAAFDKANTGVSTSTDDYARTTANTATNNITILQGVNTTQNTNITTVTSLAQAAFDKANTGTSGGSSNVTIVTSDSFVGNGSNVAFTLSVTPSSKDYTIITFDGAVQLRSSYSLTANTITFTEAPLNGENIEVTSFSSSSTLATVTINTFTGDGSTVAYTLSVSPSSKDYTFVNFDGTAQLRSSYSLSGNILTFTEAPLVGENIEVTSFTTNSISSGTTIGKAIAMSIIFGG